MWTEGSVSVPLFISLTPAAVVAKVLLSMVPRWVLIRAPGTAWLWQSRSFRYHPKEAATWSTEGGARDVWEWSLSDFPQINHFVQSPEDPTVKNTAQGRGDRRRKRQEGGVGKDMGWERRMSRERRARRKGRKGERARKGQGILSGQRASLRTTISSEHACP